jgi:hypothetical protein
MTHYRISEIAQSIFVEMGGNAESICNGECTIFAMKLIDRVGGGQVVSNLTEDMEGDFEGYAETYEIVKPECHIAAPSDANYYSTSHCWVKVDGRFYDAFNTEGVEDENYLQFIQNL